MTLSAHALYPDRDSALTPHSHTHHSGPRGLAGTIVRAAWDLAFPDLDVRGRARDLLRLRRLDIQVVQMPPVPRVLEEDVREVAVALAPGGAIVAQVACRGAGGRSNRGEADDRLHSLVGWRSAEVRA